MEEGVHNTRGESYSQNDWRGKSVTGRRTAVEECPRRDEISMTAGTREIVAAGWERGAACMEARLVGSMPTETD
jgi:hypothetical protein